MTEEIRQLITPEMFILYLQGQLRAAKVSSADNPDGIFYSIEEKKQIIDYLDNLTGNKS